jgi:hypothetical protein
VFDANGEMGPVGVSLNTSGRAIVGTTGQSGCCGVLVKNVPRTPYRLGGYGSGAGAVNPAVPIGGKAGDIVDIMTMGEIVDVVGLAAGTKYFATAGAAGTLTATVGTNVPVGWTVEATRLVVRFAA